MQVNVDAADVFGPAWIINLQPTELTVADRYSNEFVVVGLVGVVLSLILAVIVHLMFSSQYNPADPDPDPDPGQIQ